MLQYILKLTISLTIVYLFYQLFLRRLTFYNWNRWYLLLYSMVCFIIPGINVFTLIVQEPYLRESAIINYIPAITQKTPATGATAPSASINWGQAVAVVIITGMLLMVVRLLLQYYSLYKIRAKAVLLYDDKVKLYHIDEPVIPFSFGRGIYVNQHQHSEAELKDIIRHEFIHVKQRHSVDIIWSEILCIMNWYNPFAWLLRHDIRQNLEFIADQQVLQTGLDRKQYQYLLLKVIGVNSFRIANNFNFSSLKKRIAMMNKTRSARVHLLRFLFLLPLLVVILLAFRNSTQGPDQPLPGRLTDTLPKAVKEYPALKEIVTIDVTGQGKATIRLKNGKIEKYDLMIPKEKEAFKRKYGSIPEPPQPPAAPGGEKAVPQVPVAPENPEPAEMPEKPEAIEAPEKPQVPEQVNMLQIPEAPEAPVPPPAPVQADCFNKKGYCITIADNYGECVVIVKDKNKKIVQAVALTDWNKDKQYEVKYGEIPSRPEKIILNLKPVVAVKAMPQAAVSARTAERFTANQVIQINSADRITVKNDTIIATNANIVFVTRPIHTVTAVSAKTAVKLTTAVSPNPVQVKLAAGPTPATKPVPVQPKQNQ